jgi:hypothetical protein
MRAWLHFHGYPAPNPLSFPVNDNPAVLLVNAAAIIQLPNHMVWMLGILLLLLLLSRLAAALARPWKLEHWTHYTCRE